MQSPDGLLERLIGIYERFGLYVRIGNRGSSHVAEDGVGIAASWTGNIEEGFLRIRFRLGGLRRIKVCTARFERLVGKVWGEVGRVGRHGEASGRPIRQVAIVF
jgi:hypothetical protein